MIKQNKKILVITGAAPCLIEDIGAMKSLFFTLHLSLFTFDYMTIGLDAVDKYLWDIKYFATQHPKDIEAAIGRRVLLGANTDFKIIAHTEHKTKSTGQNIVDLIIPIEEGVHGSSSLMGVQAGIQLGYQKIIVCGCPLIGINEKKFDYAFYHDGWIAKYEQIKNVVRSMSGWTKDLLGAPIKDWLLDCHCEANLVSRGNL